MNINNSDNTSLADELKKVWISTKTNHLVDHISQEVFNYLCAHPGVIGIQIPMRGTTTLYIDDTMRYDFRYKTLSKKQLPDSL